MSFGNDSASLARTAAPPASIGFHGVHAARLPYLQGSAKRRAIGCVNSPPRPEGSRRGGFTQPRARLLAEPCTT